jgi:hypothetical protein
VRARGLHDFQGNWEFCRSGALTGRFLQQAAKVEVEAAAPLAAATAVTDFASATGAACTERVKMAPLNASDCRAHYSRTKSMSVASGIHVIITARRKRGHHFS